MGDRTKAKLIDELGRLQQRIDELEALGLEHKQGEEELLAMLEGISSVIGDDFFRALVRYLSRVLRARYALVGELTDDGRSVQTIAVWAGDDFAENFVYELKDTPCENVIYKEPCYYAGDVQKLFPRDKLLVEMGVESYRGIPLRNSSGDTLGILVVMNDGPMGGCERAWSILKFSAARASAELERRKAEETLRRSEESLVEAQRIARIGNWDWNIKTNELRWSDEIYRIFGLVPQEFGATYEAFLNSVHPEDREFVKRSVDDALYKKKPYSIDHRIVRPDGTERIVHEQGNVVFDSSGKPVRMIGTVQDITEQKQAEQVIKARVEQQRAVAELGQSALAGVDIMELFNEAVSILTRTLEVEFGKVMELMEDDRELLLVAGVGWKKGLVGSMRVSAGYDSQAGYTLLSSDPVIVEDLDREERFSGPSFLKEHGIKSGISVIIHTRKRPFGVLSVHTREQRRFTKDDVNFLQSIANVLAQAIERKKAEEALSQERERLAVTLRSIGDGVITTDTHGRIVMLNTVAERLTGWTQKEAEGRPLAEVFHLVDEKTGKRYHNPVAGGIDLAGTSDLTNSIVLVSKDSSERIIAKSSAPIHDMDGNVMGAVVVFRDITDKKKLETEILRASKLESLGVLAGGIAHDFNNILTAIIGNITLAKMSGDIDEIYRRLSEVEKATLRARALTQQLLTFSKGGAPIKKTSSIAELLRDSTNFILRGTNVRCEFSIPDDLLPVEIDEGQMNQVINNLIINACQAMPEGGTIRVTAENMDVKEGSSLPLKEGKYVKISIEDQGIGIPEKHISKIFDPYFTTKEGGSGLGLAASYSIIKNHSGHISVESKPGKGTTFYIFLPASGKRIARGRTEERDFVCRGRILIMEDDNLIRNVIGEMLKRSGYEVDYAVDGREACDLYRKAMKTTKPFDAVIMDLTIPGGMGGKDAIKTLLEIDPGVKAIVSSGYFNDPIMADYKKYGFKGVIAKPYEAKELLSVLQRVIVDGD